MFDLSRHEKGMACKTAFPLRRRRREGASEGGIIANLAGEGSLFHGRDGCHSKASMKCNGKGLEKGKSHL